MTPPGRAEKKRVLLRLLSTEHIDMSLNNDSAAGCLMKCLQCDLVLNSRGIKEYQVLTIASVY